MTYFAYSQPNLLKLLSQPMLFIGTENSKGPQKNTVGSFFFSTKAAQEGWTHKYSGSFGPRPSQHQSQFTNFTFQLCWLGTSQHTVMLFKLLIILFILFLRLNFPNLSPPRALKPQAPNSAETWAPGCSFMLYLFRLIRLTVYLLLIFINQKSPIDSHYLRKIAPLQEQFPGLREESALVSLLNRLKIHINT